MGSDSGWGLTLPLHGVPLADAEDLVRALPDYGYTDAWSAELNGFDAFTPQVVQSSGIDSRCPYFASTAAADRAPQPGRPG